MCCCCLTKWRRRMRKITTIHGAASVITTSITFVLIYCLLSQEHSFKVFSSTLNQKEAKKKLSTSSHIYTYHIHALMCLIFTKMLRLLSGQVVDYTTISNLRFVVCHFGRMTRCANNINIITKKNCWKISSRGFVYTTHLSEFHFPSREVFHLLKQPKKKNDRKKEIN